VLTAQVRSGIWIRNGREATAQATAYDSVHFRDLYRDLDIFLLQCCSVLLGASQFIRICLKRFELYEFLTSEITSTKRSEEDPIVKMLEEFLRFIVQVSTERTKSGSTDAALVRREIIHRLCIEDQTHSQITNNIEARIVDHPDFEKTLKEVSVSNFCIYFKYLQCRYFTNLSRWNREPIP
jgi:hypothetical protein